MYGVSNNRCLLNEYHIRKINKKLINNYKELMFSVEQHEAGLGSSGCVAQPSPC